MKSRNKKNNKKRKYQVEQVNESKVVLTATHSLSDKIIARVHKIFGEDKQITVKVDQNLIGGIKIEVGDKLYDGSIKSILTNLNNHLKQ